MSGLWLPPGALAGEFDGPVRDSRMNHFIGGLDEAGQPLPITFRSMRELADGWVITTTTPEGPANLLKATQDMFALGYYSYELVACSNAWSLFAVEAALKLRFDGPPKAPFSAHIRLAKDAGLIDDRLADHLDTGRQLRNDFVHQGKQATWTLGMAAQVIGASFELVARLYPEQAAPAG